MVRFSWGLLIILIITALISCAQAATVYGNIYSWSDFEKPLAKYYRNNVLDLAEEEQIQIMENEGKFNIDLLLFPPTDPELEYLGDINLSSNMEIKDESNLTSYLIVFLFLIAAAFATYFRPWKKKTPVSEAVSEPIAQQPTAMPKTKELPEDLHDLYALIMKKGGRVSQKELRGEMKCSEAKVSLMLDDLEDRGYIKKIRKGRSNIIISESNK